MVRKSEFTQSDEEYNESKLPAEIPRPRTRHYNVSIMESSKSASPKKPKKQKLTENISKEAQSKFSGRLSQLKRSEMTQSSTNSFILQEEPLDRIWLENKNVKLPLIDKNKVKSSLILKIRQIGSSKTENGYNKALRTKEFTRIDKSLKFYEFSYFLELRSHKNRETELNKIEKRRKSKINNLKKNVVVPTSLYVKGGTDFDYKNEEFIREVSRIREIVTAIKYNEPVWVKQRLKVWTPEYNEQEFEKTESCDFKEEGSHPLLFKTNLDWIKRLDLIAEVKRLQSYENITELEMIEAIGKENWLEESKKWLEFQHFLGEEKEKIIFMKMGEKNFDQTVKKKNIVFPIDVSNEEITNLYEKYINYKRTIYKNRLGYLRNIFNYL